ncbi:MAG TPA: FAD-dependent oxidoreductase [Pseudonocardiaceae bacterium]
MTVRVVDVVVVGGGVAGSAAAYHLAVAGLRTVLVDGASAAGQATAAGAGIISPSTSLRSGPDLLRLTTTAARHYPELIAGLAEDGAPDPGYAVPGEVFVAATDEEAARLPDLVDTWTRRRAEGLPNLGDITPIDGRAARELFPPLPGDLPAAVHVTGPARVDGALLRDALRFAAARHGAEVRPGHATLDRRGVTVDGERIAAAAVVVAAGAWTDELLAPLGVALGVAPQRGQIAHLRLPGRDTTGWPVVQGFGDHYLVAFGPDRVVAGATRETGSGFDHRLTAGGTAEVLTTALRTAPGLAAATVAEWRIGLRPWTADGLPHLGHLDLDEATAGPGTARPAGTTTSTTTAGPGAAAPGSGGGEAGAGTPAFVVATGLGAFGLTAGPFAGLVAARLVLGEDPGIDLAAYRPRPAP